LKMRIPKLLEHMEDSAGRIRDIVSELKDFSRINPPEMTDQVDMNLVVEKARGLVDTFIQRSTDFFSMECQANIPVFTGNRLKVEQVVINLLINACQALENKQQKIEVRTEYDPVLGCVIAEIHDAGIGIPEDVIDRIRDPFFTTKQSRGSTGLGLAISDRIVRDHGGKMTFFSSPGQGTSVKLFFPILDVEKIKEGKWSENRV